MRPPASTDKAALDFWTGEFRDRAMEARFLEANITTQRRQVVSLGVIIMIASWPIILLDHMAAETNPDILWITAVRGLIAFSPCSGSCWFA